MSTIRPSDRELRDAEVESIDVLEDNAGGLYFLLHRGGYGRDILISGMEQSQDAVTDCRLLRDWLDNTPEHDRWYADHIRHDEMTHVASFRHDVMTTEPGVMGTAARRYFHLDR